MLWKLVKALDGQMNKGSEQLAISKFNLHLHFFVPQLHFFSNKLYFHEFLRHYSAFWKENQIKTNASLSYCSIYSNLNILWYVFRSNILYLYRLVLQYTCIYGLSLQLYWCPNLSDFTLVIVAISWLKSLKSSHSYMFDCKFQRTLNVKLF